MEENEIEVSVPEESEEIVVDQELLDENPELAEAGVQVGDVGVAASEEESSALNAEHPLEPETA